MNKKKNQKGFTLLEILVVVALIGLLAAIGMAALASARARGEDAYIKATATNMKTQAEVFYSNNANTYGTITGEGDSVPGLDSLCVQQGSIFAASSTGGLRFSLNALNAKSPSDILCSSGVEWTSDPVTASSWAIAIKLSNGDYFCADSKGVSRDTGSSVPPISSTDADCS